jgi:hypothetical protein
MSPDSSHTENTIGQDQHQKWTTKKAHAQ